MPVGRTARLKALPKRKAEFIEPMDCAPVPHLPDGSNWVFEIKLDGYRAIAVKADGRVNLFSRRHKLFNHQYPQLVEALGELPECTVVDGEVVAFDESGRPNFNLLQHFRSEASRIHYFIFDLLVCQDRDLTRLPLSERRKLMKSVLKLRSPLSFAKTPAERQASCCNIVTPTLWRGTAATDWSQKWPSAWGEPLEWHKFLHAGEGLGTSWRFH